MLNNLFWEIKYSLMLSQNYILNVYSEVSYPWKYFVISLIYLSALFFKIHCFLVLVGLNFKLFFNFKVIHSFDAQAEGELSISVDDFVVVRQVLSPPIMSLMNCRLLYVTLSFKPKLRKVSERATAFPLL